MELKTWLQMVNYKIIEGYDYGWHWAGPNAYELASSNNTGYSDTGYYINVLFDTGTQEVYSCEAIDYNTNTAYRFFTQESYKKSYFKECAQRSVEDLAYDKVKFIDIELETDFIEKAKGIIMGIDYDKRVQIPLELDDSEIFRLMKIAHEQDVTLNQLVENILTNLIEKEKSKQSLES